MQRLILPYPPSVNHYWRHVGNKVLISREGRAYRDQVARSLAAELDGPMTGRLAVRLEIGPPDNRRRDLDNVQKSCLDALGHAGAYEDDSQIDLLVTERRAKSKGGFAIATIEDSNTITSGIVGAAFEHHSAFRRAMESLLRMAGDREDGRPANFAALVEQVESKFNAMQTQLASRN